MEKKSAAGAPKSEPRGPRGKKPAPELNEALAVIRVLSDIPKKQLATLPLTPKQVGVLIVREPKTMERDRREQRAAVAAGQEIDPLHPRSLPFVAPAGSEREVQYIASDVLAYLARRAKAVDRSFLKRGGVPELRGFQSWLGFGSASDTWPFAIQADGRPVDMIEAIATGRLGADAERLNIRQFTERLAEAASRKSANDDQAAVAKAAKPAPARTASNNRASRWDKPGGPI